MATVGDVLKHKQQSFKQKVNAHGGIVQNIVGRLHVSTPARQVIKEVRARFNKDDRSLPATKSLRKGVYKLALKYHQANRDEFTRVTGHRVFDRYPPKGQTRHTTGGKSLRPKNECAKTRKQSDPYEVWENFDGSWTWLVLKKWQIDDDKLAARWFCAVKSPFTYGSFELGDVYVHEIKSHAYRVDNKPGFNIKKYGARCI